jgi:hypothetical protein
VDLRREPTVGKAGLPNSLARYADVRGAARVPLVVSRNDYLLNSHAFSWLTSPLVSHRV